MNRAPWQACRLGPRGRPRRYSFSGIATRGEEAPGIEQRPATHRHFEHFKLRCGLTTVGEEHVLPAVFDYPRQALLYQPPLPAYDYRNADAYYGMVAAEIERFVIDQLRSIGRSFIPRRV
jgi:hypothetical protein